MERENLDAAIERRRQMRARRRRLLYLRRALILLVAAALLALMIATPIWIVRGIRNHRRRLAAFRIKACRKSFYTHPYVCHKLLVGK
jgi:hypothetical protein